MGSRTIIERFAATARPGRRYHQIAFGSRLPGRRLQEPLVWQERLGTNADAEDFAKITRRFEGRGIWRLLKLSIAMMEEARRRQHAPIRAAAIAQTAVAIAILAVAPVRLANLTSIRLGANLHKPDGPNSNYWLHFTPEATKNNVRLEFVFKEYLTRLIDEYVHDFWPVLLRGRKEDYLFPGLREGAKGKISFSVQISRRIYKATGLKMSVHQFRHAAGAIILKHRPGEFELVR
jgi:integrase